MTLPRNFTTCLAAAFAAFAMLLLGAALLAAPGAVAAGPRAAAAALSGAAAVPPPPAGVLSPRLATLATPAVRSLPPRRQARRLGVAVEGPGSLLRDGGRVLVEVRFAHGALARLGALRAAGARVLSASRRYQAATVAAAPAVLPALAATPGVRAVREGRAPVLRADDSAAAGLGATCEGGGVISEGVAQLNAAIARSKHGVDGEGVTVGILSDSYDVASQDASGKGPIATRAADDVASGDLPGPAGPCAGQRAPVALLRDLVSVPDYRPVDEGRAMAQIVHDIAPRAKLAFATAFEGELAFAESIEWLASPSGGNADVIVDDIAYFEEPFFQDGPVAVAIDKVASEGVAYFSSAGNDNLIDGSGNEIGSWEAPAYRDSGSCPPEVVTLSNEIEAAEQKQIEKEGPIGASPEGLRPTHCMDFDPGGGSDESFWIDVEAGETLTLDLQWAEAREGVGTDLDAFLFDDAGELLTGSIENNAGSPTAELGATQQPVEIVQWENTAAASKRVELVVNRFSGAAPRLKLALLQNGGGVTGIEYPVSAGGDVVGPTIFGHTAASGAVSVGAVPFGDSSRPERYSSRGPVTHYFGPVTGTTPALPLGAPEAIDKPDVVATDCGATTFFAHLVEEQPTPAWRFCGTSAAAPHAAAIAALQLDAAPAATVSELRAAQEATARAVGSFGPAAVGAGLLDADAAIADLLPPVTVALTGHPASRTRDTRPSFSFEADPPASLECALDGAPAIPCTSPYTVPVPLADGPHTFRVSVAGTPSDAASFAFAVDTAPPVVTFPERPDPYTRQTTLRFAFGTDEPAHLTCSLDGAAAQLCTSPYVTGPLADGEHRFSVTAVDQLGNGATKTVAVVVDTVAPRVSITSRPAEVSAEARPTVGFGADEPAAFSCSLDAGAPQPCASPFSSPGRLGDGQHGFGVTATDPAGNSSSAVISFTIDTRPPQTSFAKHPRRHIRTRKRRVRAVFRFGASEPGATFICKVDRGLERFCPARISRRFEAGRHRVTVKARDVAGNVDRSPAVFNFTVKRLPRRAR